MLNHARLKGNNLRWLPVIILSLIFICGGRLWAVSGENEATVRFSADPGELVLTYSSYGVNTGIEVTFSLYGNGRLEYQEFVHGAPSVPIQLRRQEEVYLEYHMVEDLLRLAVDHGLLDASRADIQDKIKSLNSGRLPLEIDCGYSTLEISLIAYSRSGKEYGPSDNKITLFCPLLRVREYSDIEEYRGFQLLSQQLTALRKSAEDTERQHNS